MSGWPNILKTCKFLWLDTLVDYCVLEGLIWIYFVQTRKITSINSETIRVRELRKWQEKDSITYICNNIIINIVIIICIVSFVHMNLNTKFQPFILYNS